MQNIDTNNKCGSDTSILRISADLDPRRDQTRPEPDSSVGSNRRMSTIRSLPSYTEPGGEARVLSDELSIYAAAFTKRETLSSDMCPLPIFPRI